MLTSWKILFGSATGGSHESRGAPCQDYASCQTFCVADVPLLVAACADGAGSASHAEVGAKLACMTFCQTAIRLLQEGLRVPDVTEADILHWHQDIHEQLRLEAEKLHLKLSDLACTLLTALVSPEGAIFSQIGDGAIVINTESGYQTVFWPQNAEYANTTYFLTQPHFAERLVVRSFGPTVDEVALFTDGLQPLALHYASRSVYAPFFTPMFQTLRQTAHGGELEHALRDFLHSPAVNDRTDDDKTLVLATRRAPTHDSHTAF